MEELLVKRKKLLTRIEDEWKHYNTALQNNLEFKDVKNIHLRIKQLQEEVRQLTEQIRTNLNLGD